MLELNLYLIRLMCCCFGEMLMVFSSSVFLLLFLPIVFVLNWFIKEKYSNGLLLAASLVFYAWGEPFLVLLMIASILINWGVGCIISKTSGVVKGLALSAGVICDLGILGYYKYAAFFARTVNSIIGRRLLPVTEVVLPIGISFFTFQAISYIVDVYRGNTEASYRLINVALYISFFPQLIAGPIVKYREINRQIEERFLDWEKTAAGFKRFIYGLGKKVLISNILGLCVDTIYGYDLSLVSSKMAWIGAAAYSLQIYYDFSGYSDMAIGLGKMFGFTILENFQYPYMSKSISEFWRRWHISLGSWFREYVYIPLGGNRKGKVRTYVNLGFVFLLTGLWHGADFSFIIWGLYHGFFAIIERLGFRKILSKIPLLSVLYTDLLVNFGWVLFRADDTITALRYLCRMLAPWRYSGLAAGTWEYMDFKTIVVLILGFLGMGFQSYIPEKIRKIWDGSVPEALYCSCLLILSIAAVASNTYNPFIYFQF